jgi:EpsD family peptidyl-prolyl cis-trans isomerase
MLPSNETCTGGRRRHGDDSYPAPTLSEQLNFKPGQTSMKLRFGVVLCASACLLLVSCGKGKEPGGQVAATVDGKEITMIDLRNEMAGYTAPDAKTRKLAERAALDQIIVRKLLVDAAEKQKMDQTPEFVQQKQRVDETLLVRFWQNRIAKSVPAPSKDEIDRFVAAHPDLYANHRVFLLDQIRMPQITDQALFAELKPLKSLPEVGQLLASKNIPFQQGETRLDSLTVDPAIVDQLLKLPSDDVFVMPQGNLLVVSKIREIQTTPVPPNIVTKHATQVITAQRTREAVQRELGGALAGARAKKGAVKYAKGYEPPKPPAKAASAAPAQKK